jgi:hypothetical protein
MARFEVIESKVWKRNDGATASIYGAVPWLSPGEEKRWKMVSRGYTVRDNDRGTVGIGRQAWATRAEAQAWVDKETKRLAEARRWHEANYPKKTPAASSKRSHATTKSPAQLQREIEEALATGQGRGRGRGRGAIGSWTQRGTDWVSEDKRFAIRGDRMGKRWFIVDLDTYDEAEAPSFIEATRAAKIMRGRRRSA